MVTRRTTLKIIAQGSTALAATKLLGQPLLNLGNKASPGGLSWKKSPCRFCGVGCGLLIGIQNGRALAVKGDPDSPVNKGLCCVKGYHSVLALYGSDRLKKAYIRKNGQLVEATIKEALDVVAKKMQDTIKAHGKDAVSMYGSGQWTIPDGYLASKFMKGAIGTNNLEANARLCMASAVTGFLTSFGLDEPMGCYEDIEHADTFVLWGNNMAEMHPVLFSRLLAQKEKRDIEIIDLSTRTTQTSNKSTKTILFKPQTDLAIANAICYELIKNKKIDTEFVANHCSFKKGKTAIGYGLEDGFKFQDKSEKSTFQEYFEFLKSYSVEKVSKLSNVSVDDLKYLSSLYGNPNKNIVSFWCMGVNQHTRGTWMNNLIYNIHLLTKKISLPGNSPFSLTGQPSACGTVREVGTLTNRLPHGVVTNKEHREEAAKIWQVPVQNISPTPTYDTVEMFRALDRGDIKFMWIQVTNPMVTMPKLKRYRDACKKADRFIVVSDVYPTPTTEIADVVLPSAMWIEREGMFGNSERRTQHFEKMIEPPGEAMSDGWQIIEVAKRMGFSELFPYTEENYIEKVWEEYSKFHDNDKHRMASYDLLKQKPGVMWPIVNGQETKWRYHKNSDPAAKNGTFDFYGTADHRAVIWQRPFEPAPEVPDNKYPFLLCTGRVIEHWHTGSMTRRVKVLHQAMPKSYVEIHPDDAVKLKVKNHDRVLVRSRRGEIILRVSLKERGQPEPGQVFVPFFDESLLINELTLDSFCPISKQPDYKKCAVQIIKL